MHVQMGNCANGYLGMCKRIIARKNAWGWGKRVREHAAVFLYVQKGKRDRCCLGFNFCSPAWYSMDFFLSAMSPSCHLRVHSMIPCHTMQGKWARTVLRSWLAVSQRDREMLSPPDESQSTFQLVGQIVIPVYAHVNWRPGNCSGFPPELLRAEFAPAPTSTCH